MEKLIYKEEQSFRQSFVPWLMLPAFLFTLIMFIVGLYQQIYLGKPLGNNPMSNNGLIWSGILTLALLGAVFIFVLSSKLLTEIWTDGIRYKFPPLLRKLRHIPLSEIATAEVTKYNPIGEFGGWGWRKRLLKRKTAYNISGSIGVRIVKKDGSVIIFGTVHKEEMQRAVAKMMVPANEKYKI